MNRFPSIRKNTEYREIYHTAASKSTGLLVMYVRDGKQMHNRLGISVSKRNGNSVIRHTFTRRIRHIFMTHDPRTIQGKDIIIVARNQAGHASFRQLEKDYVKLLGSHRIIKDSESLSLELK